MDTSKEYIEMCEKAEEVQETWKPSQTPGDFYATKGAYSHGVNYPDKHSPDGYMWITTENRKEYIWLPRQDQLQEMLPKRATWFENLYRFYEWMSDKSEWESPCVKFKSLEQLWLAFVMKQKYGKTWNGKEWVKE